MQDASPTKISLAQREACRAAIQRGLQSIRIPQKLPLSQWADRHFYLSEESSAVEGPWESLPFQRAMMDCMGSRAVRIVDVWKCARIGYTKMLLALTAYNVTHFKRNTGIYQPVDGDAQDFTKDEINPLLRDVPAFREALDADPEKVTKDNKLDFKKFRGANLYIRGAHTNRSFRRITLDTVIYDELESFERDVDEEGSPVKLGDGRISNSTFPKSIRGSTPRESHDSLIAGEAEKARHMFWYFVPCPYCDELQRLEWKQFRWQKEGSIDERAESVTYECKHCEDAVDYSHLGMMLDGGEWRTDDGYSIECTDHDPLLRDSDGKIVDWPRHIAFRIWAAYSPFFSWEDLVYEWLDAQGDYTDLKTFTNIRLGELWDEVGEQVEHSVLYQRREQYDRPTADCLLLTAGVDVQDNRLEVEVVGWGAGFESWSIEYRVLYGDPEQPEVWRDLDDVLTQVFETEDGRKLQIAGVGADTGHLANHVYAWSARSAHNRVYCLKGSTNANAPLVSPPSRQRVGRTGLFVDLFTVGVSAGKSITYKWLNLKERGAGYCHFPISYSEEYFEGLTAEKKITKKRKGFDVVEWVRERRNEPLDCRNYAYITAVILNPVWEALAGREVPKKSSPATQDFEQRVREERRTRRQRKSKRGFVKRW